MYCILCRRVIHDPANGNPAKRTSSCRCHAYHRAKPSLDYERQVVDTHLSTEETRAGELYVSYFQFAQRAPCPQPHCRAPSHRASMKRKKKTTIGAVRCCLSLHGAKNQEETLPSHLKKSKGLLSTSLDRRWFNRALHP